MTDEIQPGHDGEGPHQHDLMELFEELSLRQKFVKVWRGIQQPKYTGDYKYARLEILRLLAPLSAVLFPCLVVGLLMLFATMQPQTVREVEVQIVEPESIEDLEDIEDLQQEPIEPPEPIDMEFTAQVNTPVDSPIQTQSTDVSPQPATFDSVAMIKSPIVMRGIYGSRSPGARGEAMKEYGGTGISEGAVLRALRWLVKEQQPDGSWKNNKPAMTALALLSFLAHGETPASEEFGPTVEKAIKFLVEAQEESGLFKGRDGNNYTHPIVVYALSEAYALTRVPMVKQVTEKALAIIVKGQHENGGWDYNMKQSLRDDTSYIAWCVQALKAAKMADLHVEGLEECMKRAVGGLKKNAHPEGGFGYTDPGRGGLTGAGVLCMQFLGAAKEPEVRKSLLWLEESITIDWKQPYGSSPIYYWYYITQAKFHAGGKPWSDWNKIFARELVQNQVVLKGEGIDGKDIGYWDSPSEHEHRDGRVQDTCLCALQLQVYYRYLPTFKTPKDSAVEDDVVSDEDIEVDITL